MIEYVFTRLLNKEMFICHMKSILIDDESDDTERTNISDIKILDDSTVKSYMDTYGKESFRLKIRINKKNILNKVMENKQFVDNIFELVISDIDIDSQILNQINQFPNLTQVSLYNCSLSPSMRKKLAELSFTKKIKVIISEEERRDIGSLMSAIRPMMKQQSYQENTENKGEEYKSYMSESSYKECMEVLRTTQDPDNLSKKKSIFDRLGDENMILAHQKLLSRDHHSLQHIQDIKKYMIKILDVFLVGVEKTKGQILSYMISIITNQRFKNVLCLVGEPGTGKSTIIKGIAACFCFLDRLAHNGNHINQKALDEAFAFAIEQKGYQFYYSMIDLGKSSDIKTFEGFSEAYKGSTHGSILESVLFASSFIKEHGRPGRKAVAFEELDKADNSVISLFLGVFDNRGDSFRDGFLGGFGLGLLKRMCPIATANSIDNVSAPIKSRLLIINMPAYTLEEKIKILAYDPDNKAKIKDLEALAQSMNKNVTFDKSIYEYVIYVLGRSTLGARSDLAMINMIFTKLESYIESSQCPNQININSKNIGEILRSIDPQWVFMENNVQDEQLDNKIGQVYCSVRLSNGLSFQTITAGQYQRQHNPISAILNAVSTNEKNGRVYKFSSDFEVMLNSVLSSINDSNYNALIKSALATKTFSIYMDNKDLLETDLDIVLIPAALAIISLIKGMPIKNDFIVAAGVDNGGYLTLIQDIETRIAIYFNKGYNIKTIILPKALEYKAKALQTSLNIKYNKKIKIIFKEKISECLSYAFDAS